jgi:hypothetical protein
MEEQLSLTHQVWLAEKMPSTLRSADLLAILPLGEG